MRWLVIGEKGVVQFLVYTGWLPEPPAFGKRDFGKSHFAPSPADLGYHSKEPMYEGQEPMSDNCEFLGGKCYYDGSGLNADEPFRVLCNEGGEALWQYLEAVYRSQFHGEPWPKEKPYKFAPRSPSVT